jgi:GNAT superfamily N-acetyltransferase
VPDIVYRAGFAAEAFLALAQRVWPRDYSLAAAGDALTRTTNIGAWDGDRLVGSVRLLTDGHFFATITEILVDPEYQRRGIGRRLMELALDHAPRGKMAFGAQPEAVAFFERIGCERRLTSFVASRQAPTQFELWRQDDNGNRVLIRSFAERPDAEAALRQFESLHHKQTYWVEPRETSTTDSTR